MKEIDLILPHILPYAPGCPDPTAYFGVRQAAIEFCERTRMWRSEDEFPVSSEGCDAIFAPYGAVVHEIESAFFDGLPLVPASIAYLDDCAHGWRDDLLAGLPKYVTQTEPNTVRVVPRQAGTLKLSLWLKPAQDTDELPDFMIDQYRETIAHGALARILMMPNQSFTNLETGTFYAMSFNSKIEALFTKGIKGQQRAAMRTKASFF